MLAAELFCKTSATPTKKKRMVAKLAMRGLAAVMNAAKCPIIGVRMACIYSKSNDSEHIGSNSKQIFK
jgi:hypothetical protein